jgi:hypothetical protein
MYPRNAALQHPAGPMLLQYATEGCPALCGANWTVAQMQAAIDYNNHISAQQPEAAAFVRRQVLDKVHDNLCHLVSWDDIKDNPPANLKISPLAAIPHKSREFRTILDLSFELSDCNGAPPCAVNTPGLDPDVPHHSQNELHNAIPRIIYAMATSQDPTPFFFCKMDIKDGFWRMRVRQEDSWNFAFVLPRLTADEPIQLVVPFALQMGWQSSPPYFDAATETARDLADQYSMNPELPPHPLEHHLFQCDLNTEALILNTRSTPSQHLNKLIEVYVDDFLPVVQSCQKADLLHVTRATLHAIYDLFPPPALTGSTLEEPVSIKKLLDEGAWATTKEILGWKLNGIDRTISISKEKYDKLIKRLDTVLGLKRARFKDIDELKGKLQWTSAALITCKPLLGDLDYFVYRLPKRRFIDLPPALTQIFRDWKLLLHQLYKRPISVHELVSTPPAYCGTCDSSNWGAGGVWFSGTKKLLPIVWFVQWPAEICQRRQNDEISIGLLELLAILLQWIVLEQAVAPSDLRHTSVAMRSDNTQSVAWATKFRSSADPKANRCLKALTLRLQQIEAAPPIVDHISGIHNCMADVASREHPTNPTAFLQHFTSHFPPPQNNCWHLCTLATKTIKRAFSLAQTTPSDLVWWTQPTMNDAVFGTYGQVSWTPTTPISGPIFQTLTNHNNLHCWEPTPNMYAKEMATFLTAPGNAVSKGLNWRSEPSPRPSNWTECRHQYLLRKAPTLLASNDNSKPTAKKTHQRVQN